MQEVIVSRAAFICCGRYVASWRALVHFLIPPPPVEALTLEAKGQYMSYRVVQAAASDLVWPMAQLIFRRQHCDKITYWEGLQLARKRRASDPRDYIFSLLGFVHEILVDVSYEVTVSELYRSLVENLIKRDKVLDILTMCRNFDPDLRGHPRIAEETSVGDTTDGLGSIFDLLLLSKGSHKNDKENEEPNKRKSRGLVGKDGEWEFGADDPKDTRGFHKTGRIKNTGKEISAKEQVQDNGDGGDKSFSAINTAINTATEASLNTSLIESDLALLPSWVPRWGVDETHSGVQIALDPRRTGSCSASGSLLAKVEFSMSRMIAQGIFVDVVDCYYTVPLQNHLRLLCAIGEAETQYQKSNVDMTWDRFHQEWNLWGTFVEQQGVSRYETLDAQRWAYVNSVLIGLKFGGEDQRGAYYDLLALKLGWPLRYSFATDPSLWQADALEDSQKHKFVITKRGFMERGLDKTEGDIVCILYGGRVPFVLSSV
jgi:hypothetical protein